MLTQEQIKTEAMFYSGIADDQFNFIAGAMWANKKNGEEIVELLDALESAYRILSTPEWAGGTIERETRKTLEKYGR